MKRWQRWYDKAKAYGRFLLTGPSHELTRAQRAMRYAINVVRRCWWKMEADNAQEMAAALTYRTIFGLIPVVVLALLVFRAFGGLEAVGSDLQSQFYEYMGWDFRVAPREAVEPGGAESVAATQPAGSAASTPATQPAVAPEAAAAATQPSELDAQRAQAKALNKILADLNEQVADVNFTSIGLVGIAILVWAALSLVVTVEQCFNRVFDCEVGRSWSMRVAIYWAAITLGPVLLMLSIWLTSQVTGWIDQLPAMIGVPAPWGGDISQPFVNMLQSVLNVLSYGAALVATWILFVLLYVLLPNTRVKVRAAIIGAFVAAALWETGKWAFGLYVENAVGYSALYGALGLIPLFLLWLYVTWLIVLLGLALTYTLQSGPGEHARAVRQPGGRVLVDPRWLIPLMAIFAERFERGEVTTVEDLAHRTGLARRTVSRLAQQLRQAGLIRAVSAAGSDGAQPHVLAKPADQITLGSLVALGQRLGLEEQAGANDSLPAWDVVTKLGRAQGEAVDHLTLAEAIQPARSAPRRGSG